MRKYIELLRGFIEGAFVSGAIVLAVVFIVSLHRQDKPQPGIDYNSLVSGQLDSQTFRCVVEEKKDKELVFGCQTSDESVMKLRESYMIEGTDAVKYVWDFDILTKGNDLVCIETYDKGENLEYITVFNVSNSDEGLTYSLYNNDEVTPEQLDQIHQQLHNAYSTKSPE